MQPRLYFFRIFVKYYKNGYLEEKEEGQLYCEHCKLFLADRYIIGICPKCGSEIKGDECEKCGSLLTIDEVKDIAISTAVKDSYVAAGDPVQWGAGKFDAYAGLKEVIRRAENDGVENIVSGNNARLMISTTGHNIFEAFVGDANKMDAIIYNIAGQPVFTQSCEGNEITIDASSLNAGVYIISINNRYNQRILIK